MSTLFTYELLIAGVWCAVTDIPLYESVNGNEKAYFKILKERQKKIPTDLVRGVSGKGFEELGF